uniref:Uncharacterized protein n=1 Tax=Anguilla anguilla TaxID=7936 RepID=A0A0E9W6H7_ANGAN
MDKACGGVEHTHNDSNETFHLSTRSQRKTGSRLRRLFCEKLSFNSVVSSLIATTQN